MEEVYTLNKAESDVQMALRLMTTLDYQQEMRALKRSYVLERWPENSKKHKMLGFLTEKYVPERYVREEKDIFAIKSLVGESIKTLCCGGQKNDASWKPYILDCSPEPCVGKVEKISDLELVTQAPLMLCSLNKKALKVLLFTLTGKQLTSNHRYIFEREIEKEFLKLMLPSREEGLPESLVKVASVIRNPSSYRHTLRSIDPRTNLFSNMPLSAIAAAREAFTRVGNLPTRIVVEVGKLLIQEDNKNLPLSFEHKTHLKTVQAVNQEAERQLSHLNEGDLLPACLEGALQTISLSARILFGHDGGLARLLRPLSQKKLALERDFQAAYSQVEKMETKDLAKVCNALHEGPKRPQRKKQVYIDELQRLLIDSMHCIYAFDGFPEHVTKTLLMINASSHSATEAKAESDHGKDRVYKKGERKKRLKAEIDSILDVSAQFQSAVWECFESRLEAAKLNISRSVSDTETSSMNLDPAAVNLNPTFPSSNLDTAGANLNPTFPSSDPDVDTICSEMNQPSVKMEMEVLEDGQSKEFVPSCSARRQRMVPQDLENYIQIVELFSDEAAAIVYVLIGCLLKDVVVQRSLSLDSTELGYLQTGLDKPQPSRTLPDAKILPASCESLDADELVLGIAKKLKVIPLRVILEAERQLQHHCI